MFESLRLYYLAVRSAISTLSQPQRWFVEMFGGSKSKSGADVSETTAVQVTAVFACVRLLAQTIASLPLHVYRRTEGNEKEKAYDHPLYMLLHEIPNTQCTSYQLRMILMTNLLLTGNAFAEIVRDNAGAVREIWPIPSSYITIHKTEHRGEIRYLVTMPDGQFRMLMPEEMLHIQWVGMENFKSFSPVMLAREAIGLSIAAEEFGSLFFENGANASGIVEYPGKLSDDGYQRFQESFKDKYTGLDKNQRLMFLEEGLKFHKLTVDPTDAQSIETRKFQVIEIARFYNVPPHLIMDLERATFSNVEHQDISFVKYSLRPYLVCIEQEMKRSLFTGLDRQQYFAEFNVDGLLRGDAESRARAMDIMMRNGVINADEWRALENMNPQPDELGKTYYVPLNWIPKERSTEIDTGERQRLKLEHRMEKRGGVQKLRAAERHEQIFRDAAQRIVNRETKDIKQKLKSTHNQRNDEEFNIWLEQYYENAPSWMKRTIMPVLLTYAEVVHDISAAEVGDVDVTDGLREYMQGYADIWAANYVRSSKGQIQALIRKAQEEGQEVVASLEQRLEEWEERRPAKVAKNETIEAAGVVSKFVFGAAGVRYLRWVNAGDDTCPFCQELNGKVVGIDQPFVGREEKLTAEDEDTGMRVRKPALTPPIHQGCVCQIEPE